MNGTDTNTPLYTSRGWARSLGIIRTVDLTCGSFFLRDAHPLLSFNLATFCRSLVALDVKKGRNPQPSEIA